MALIPILIFLGAVGLAYFAYKLQLKQKYSIYQPCYLEFPRNPDFNPLGLKIPKDRDLTYEDIEINSGDSVLRGWFLPTKKENQTIVVFHEEFGNLGSKLYYLACLHQLTNANILIVAYRGFSKSSGTPSEQGLIEDARKIMDYIKSRKDIDASKIYILGRSLGAALAVQYVTENEDIKVKGLILDNIIEKAQDMLSESIKAEDIDLKDKWPTFKRISNLKTRSLFIISTHNIKTSALRQSLLYDEAKQCQDKQLYTIDKSSLLNNWCIHPKEYFNRIRQFISE